MSYNHMKQVKKNLPTYIIYCWGNTRINSRVLDFYNPPLGSFTRSDCFAHQYHPVKGHFVMAHPTRTTGAFFCNLYFMCKLPHSRNICAHHIDPNLIAHANEISKTIFASSFASFSQPTLPYSVHLPIWPSIHSFILPSLLKMNSLKTFFDLSFK